MTRRYSQAQRLQNIAVTAIVAFAALLAIAGLIVLSLVPEHIP
jgi:hypothetical protein